MSLDVVIDPLIDAVRAIAKSVVNASLQTSLEGAEAIVSTMGFPAPLETIEQVRLPVLCVYVASEAARRSSARHLDSRCEVTFEYILPATALHKLDLRWPLLRGVWAALVPAVAAGMLEGVPALSVAGVVSVDEDAAAVRYSFATDGEQAYPVFTGTIPLTARRSGVAITQELVEMVARINRVEPDANPDIQPQVELLLVPAP